MPNLDKTGPQGRGSKTGRGLGKCRDKNQVNSDFSGNFRRENRQKLNRRDASCLGSNRKTNH